MVPPNYVKLFVSKTSFDMSVYTIHSLTVPPLGEPFMDPQNQFSLFNMC